MAQDDRKEIKSSYELVMERLRARGEAEPARLTEDQKRALAEADAQTRARIAEVEILLDRKIAEARAQGDAEALEKLQEQKQTELRRIREEGERKKEAIRRGA